MPWISGFVSLGLVWFFGLVVIFWFWWRCMPAHDPCLTLFLGAVLWVTLFVFGASLAGAWTHLKFENHEAQRPVYWQWSVPLVFLVIVGATLVRTGKEPVFGEYESVENRSCSAKPFAAGKSRRATPKRRPSPSRKKLH